jgi:transcriptional regulator with XRE-family HTH domain
MRMPIADSVNPLSRNSLIRDAQVVMASTLRVPVDPCQRLPVTAIRENESMPKPAGLPKFSSVGPRVRWWRVHRKMSRKDLAAKVGLSYSGLADLENDRQQGSGQLHLIAAALRLNPHYVETDKGEPEADIPQEAPEDSPTWPFETIPRPRLNRLNRIEQKYVEMKLKEILDEIEAEHRKSKRSG